MYIALSVEYGRDDQLIFAQQLGVEHVLVSIEDWDETSLNRVKNRVEKSALQLAGLEGLALGDVDAASAALRAAGRVGIGLVVAAPAAIDDRGPRGRGAALVGSVGVAAVAAAAIAPVVAMANEAGVQLALAADIEGAGVDLDLATMGSAAIADYGERLALVRAGNATAGRQAFLNEGETDVPGALMALKKAGFNGPIRAVAPPGMVGDTEWGHKGRAYDLGYLKAVLQTIESI